MDYVKLVCDLTVPLVTPVLVEGPEIVIKAVVAHRVAAAKAR